MLKSSQESGYYLYANHTCADADPLIPTMVAYPKEVYVISLNDHEHSIKYFELSANELERENNAGHENYELRVFITNMNLCVEYYALGEYERAEEYLNRAGVYMDHPSIENNRFHYLTVQSNLFMKTGRQEEARKNFPELLELTLNAEDRSDFWGDMEMLGNLALELREFTAMKRILDNMERNLSSLRIM